MESSESCEGEFQIMLQPLRKAGGLAARSGIVSSKPTIVRVLEMVFFTIVSPGSLIVHLN
jgi:hypothetical protein